MKLVMAVYQADAARLIHVSLVCSDSDALQEFHNSCTNNLHTSLGQIGWKLTDDPEFYLTPAPFNLWMVRIEAVALHYLHHPKRLFSLSPAAYPCHEGHRQP